MFQWIFSKYSKQPIYRALPDGCLSTNRTKIIWILNHAFSAARQPVLYYDCPVFCILKSSLLEGSYEFGSVYLILCPPLAHLFWNPLISFSRYWGVGLSFIGAEKWQSWAFWKNSYFGKKGQKRPKVASKFSFWTFGQKIKLLDSSETRLKWKY